MGKRVSIGQMFAISVEVDDNAIKRMKAAPQYVQETLQDGAAYWHTGILPGHFNREAHGKYGYADRTEAYLKTKGANPDLVKTGSLKASVMGSYIAKAKNKSAVELKMFARSLNFVPNGGNPFDLKIMNDRSVRGGGYPNMKREIVITTGIEQQEITNIIESKLAALLSG